MSLTTSTNGSSAANQIAASWFNDFKDVLTGNMQDQKITVQNNLVLKALGTTPGAPSLSHTTGTTLGVGNYTYAVTFGSDDGESTTGTTAGVTTTTGSTNVSITAIPTGPTGTTKRNVYRTKVNATQLYLLTTLNDNSTTTYADSTADTSLTVLPPDFSTFGGSLLVKNSSGTTVWKLYNDGHMPGGMYFISPYQFLNNGSINSGTTSPYTVTNVGGIPSIAKGVMVAYAFTSTVVNTYATFTPQGTAQAAGNYPVSPLNQINSSMVLAGSCVIPVNTSNGQIDIKAVNGNTTSFNAQVYGYIL